jgi:hypothetical protein
MPSKMVFSITGTSGGRRQASRGRRHTAVGHRREAKPEQVGEAMYSPISDDVPSRTMGNDDAHGRSRAVRPSRRSIRLCTSSPSSAKGFSPERRAARAGSAAGRRQGDARPRPVHPGRVLDLAGAPVPGARVWMRRRVAEGCPTGAAATPSRRHSSKRAPETPASSLSTCPLRARTRCARHPRGWRQRNCSASPPARRGSNCGSRTAWRFVAA